MVLHDARRAAQVSQRLKAHNPTPSPEVDVPEPLQDELKVGRLDTALVGLCVGASPARVAEIDAAGSYLVQDGVDELRLDLDGRLSWPELIVLADRADDRGLGRAPVETLEPQRVREQV